MLNLQESRAIDNFSENNLNQWMEQLKEFKEKFTLSSRIELIEDENFATPLLSIKQSIFYLRHQYKKPTTSFGKYRLNST